MPGDTRWPWRRGPGGLSTSAGWMPGECLVAVVGEVIYRLDAGGEIPVTAAVRPVPDGGVVLTLALADVTEAEITGAVPKGASLHDLRCAADASGRWSCGITIDV
jgi:SHS2 domain-containing protein